MSNKKIFHKELKSLGMEINICRNYIVIYFGLKIDRLLRSNIGNYVSFF